MALRRSQYLCMKKVFSNNCLWKEQENIREKKNYKILAGKFNPVDVQTYLNIENDIDCMENLDNIKVISNTKVNLQI